jgi:hypothetical protein
MTTKCEGDVKPWRPKAAREFEAWSDLVINRDWRSPVRLQRQE